MSEAKRVDPRHLEAATDSLLGIEFRDEAHMNAAHILVANAIANAESAQPAERAGHCEGCDESGSGPDGSCRGIHGAERAGEWVSVERDPLLGVLAYLSAEIGQYYKEHHAPPRIRRAKELLEKMLPPPPQDNGQAPQTCSCGFVGTGHVLPSGKCPAAMSEASPPPPPQPEEKP